MSKTTRIYGWPLLVLLLLLLSACGAKANEPAAEHTMDIGASPASSDAANNSVQETVETASPASSPAATPEPSATPSEEPAATEKPQETVEPNITQAPSATAKPIETKQPTSTPLSKPSPTVSPKATPTPKPSKAPEVTEPVTVHTVEITNFAFSPAKLEIKQGDIVTFINKDEVAHTATADNDDFDTGLLDQNNSKKITFSEAGEFSYYCAPHPGMKGTIVVKEK